MHLPACHAAVFGATSAIAGEFLRALVAERTARLLLVGRNQQRLAAVAGDLTARGAECLTWCVELADPAIDWGKELAARAGGREWDLFLLAHGTLPDQQRTLADGRQIAATIAANFTSHATIAAACAGLLQQQGRGTLAVIGSVAGDRARQSNFLYGSAKAGIDAFMAGMRHRLAHQRDIRCVLLKPGMTDTPMTADLPKGPLFSSAETVGRLAWEAVKQGRPVAYLPRRWRWIMTVIRMLPDAVLHRTKL